MDLFSQPIEEDKPKNKDEDKTITQDNNNEKDYSRYYALTDYHRRCLPTTNFWHLVNGTEPISVPNTDTYYYNHFTERERLKAIEINKKQCK